MPTWVTHLILADRLFSEGMSLHKRGFSVGSVGPDCNVENEDWTRFIPPREVTHFTRGRRKALSDAEDFYRERMEGKVFSSCEERAFHFGYFAHILTDALYQDFVHRAENVRECFGRLSADPVFRERRGDREESFDTLKELFGSRFTYGDLARRESEYLRTHPSSLFFTELCRAADFPDYMPEFPAGAFSRKIAVMARPPEPGSGACVFWTERKYEAYLLEAFSLLRKNLSEKGVLFAAPAAGDGR